MLETTDRGRWVGSRYWALLYPAALLTIRDVLAKSGQYYVTTRREWKYCSEPFFTMEELLPTEGNTGALLQRKLHGKTPLTIHYTYYQDGYRISFPCYLFEKVRTSHGQGNMPLMLRSRYYDMLSLLYPDAQLWGRNHRGPVFVTSGKHVWIGIIMPVDYPHHGLERSLVSYKEHLHKMKTREEHDASGP